VLVLALPVLALALAGCPKKPKDGNCNSNADCAAQQGFGKVCVQGRCQECQADADCPAGFSCRDLKCVPKAAPTECDASRPCPQGKACEGGRCVDAAPQDAGAAGAPADAGAAAGACELPTVTFDFDQATLRPDARDALQKAADCAKARKIGRLAVEGHADERGTNEYNQHLALRRAESVRRYLGNLGVAAGSIETTSFGEEQPLCTESTEECWARNRRAELKAR
jgi:peptidoglycan-associated lipoprotein